MDFDFTVELLAAAINCDCSCPAPNDRVIWSLPYAPKARQS